MQDTQLFGGEFYSKFRRQGSQTLRCLKRSGEVYKETNVNNCSPWRRDNINN